MTDFNKRILIIDDDREIWQAYQRVLLPDTSGSTTLDLNKELNVLLGEESSAELSFELTFAAQGQEGFSLAEEALRKEEPFALAFVDIRMPPGWNGMETASELHKLDPNLELIIVTAYADYSCEEIVRCVGAPHKLLFFRKPFDPEELRQLAASLTEKWHIARQEKTRRRELYHLNEELKKKMAEMQVIQAKQLKLERELHQAQKMEAIGLMASGVAHDLNNILSGLVSYPDLLLLDKSLNGKVRRSIEVIRESGQRAADVVADLLTVARGAASEQKIADLNTLIKEYLQSPEGDNLKSLYPDITITTDYADGGAGILCSPVHIKKCLMNLITNAAEAIGTSGTITVSTTHLQTFDDAPKDVEPHPAGYVLLTIADDGPGIPPEDMEHIFEPFYTKKVMGRSGTGLGLALVWNTVKDHHGKVKVQSTKKGTTFRLYFPAATDKAVPARKTDRLEDLQGSGTILVVDDDKMQRNLTKEMLGMLGYTVDTADSGENAVAYLEDHKVDLVVLDMIMAPGMDGCRTYEKIVAMYPGQKAIIISGFSENSLVNEARAMGVGSYVRKPFSMEQIGRAVKKELER